MSGRIEGVRVHAEHLGCRFAAHLSVRNGDVDTDSEFIVATTAHVIAAPGNLLVSYGLVSLLAGVDVAAWLVFGLVGVQTTVTYNLLTLLEDTLTYVVDAVTA